MTLFLYVIVALEWSVSSERIDKMWVVHSHNQNCISSRDCLNCILSVLVVGIVPLIVVVWSSIIKPPSLFGQPKLAM